MKYYTKPAYIYSFHGGHESIYKKGVIILDKSEDLSLSNIILELNKKFFNYEWMDMCILDSSFVRTVSAIHTTLGAVDIFEPKLKNAIKWK